MHSYERFMNDLGFLRVHFGKEEL